MKVADEVAGSDSAAGASDGRWSRTIRTRIQAAALTPAEEGIAKAILDRYPQSALLNGRDLARLAGVSPASVTRFAAKLGYAGFQDLQDVLKVEIRARLMTPPKRLALDERSRRRNPAAVLRDALERDADNLHRTVSLIDGHEFVRFVRALNVRSSRTIYVAGSKKAATVAQYFATQLNQIRPNVVQLALADALPDRVLDFGERDLLVLFEPRRATRQLVRLADTARRAGMRLAVFSDEHPPKSLATADFLFPTAIDSLTIFDSYAALFALCHAVLAAFIQAAPRAVRLRTGKLESLNRAFVMWDEP